MKKIQIQILVILFLTVTLIVPSVAKKSRKTTENLKIELDKIIKELNIKSYGELKKEKKKLNSPGLKIAVLKRDDLKTTLLNGGKKYGWKFMWNRPKKKGEDSLAWKLKKNFKLPDSDKYVKALMMFVIKTGTPQDVKIPGVSKDGKKYVKEHRIFRKEISGKTVKVIVDNGKFKGSVICADLE